MTSQSGGVNNGGMPTEGMIAIYGNSAKKYFNRKGIKSKGQKALPIIISMGNIEEFLRSLRNISDTVKAVVISHKVPIFDPGLHITAEQQDAVRDLVARLLEKQPDNPGIDDIFREDSDNGYTLGVLLGKTSYIRKNNIDLRIIP